MTTRLAAYWTTQTTKNKNLLAQACVSKSNYACYNLIYLRKLLIECQKRARPQQNHGARSSQWLSQAPMERRWCGESSGPGNVDVLPVWSLDIPEGVWWGPGPHGSWKVRGLCLLPTTANMYTVSSHQASTNSNLVVNTNQVYQPCLVMLV